MDNPAQTSAATSGEGGAPSTLDLTGRTLADFRILRQLGQGGMGQVYLAEQMSLKRKVALKILRPELGTNPTSLQRFKAEAEAVAKAIHANIVQVYAFGEADGVAYMALEYVEGRNLREYVARKGPPDLLVAISIMRQVASALQRASEMGIIHRDVKPENILLTRKGEVKVADFGLARCLEGDKPALNLTQSGVTMGTPLYMSPEQVEGKPVDSRTDIYSFGATCYHMLAGQPPFRGSTAFEVALQHVRAEPTPLRSIRPDLPEALCAVVHKMMAKAPDQRYQTGRDLLRDVVRLREGLSGATGAVAIGAGAVTMVSPGLAPLSGTALTPASVPTVAPITPPPAARTRAGWLAGAAVASVVLAVCGGAVFAWAQRRAGPLRPGTVVPIRGGAPVEGAHLPPRVESEKEQTLRKAAELALDEGATVESRTTSFGNCLGLGVLYLQEDRLDEAEKLFARLETVKAPDAYPLLGQLGQGIVLALRNQPDKSNVFFAKAFPRAGWARPKGERAWGAHLGPLGMQMFDNQKWRYWMSQARWFNKTNGKDVPAGLLRRLTPLGADGLPVVPPRWSQGKG